MHIHKLTQRLLLSTFAVPMLLTVMVSACAAMPQSSGTAKAPERLRSTSVNVSPEDVKPEMIDERFASSPIEGIELDSPATWYDKDGKPFVFVSGKGTHQIAVFDGTNGELINVFGSKGSELGQFKRPNGLAVFRNLLLVAERDNHRVQVFRLPDLKPLLTFGEDQLQAPYGVWLNSRGPNEADLYVTDSFMEGKNFDVFPHPSQLNKRLQVFRLSIENGKLAPRWTGNFGSTSPAAGLHRVESLSGNPDLQRLLIVDEEDKDKKSTIREYTLDGVYTGNSIGNKWIKGQAEGIAMLRCHATNYWIVADQMDLFTVFHVFGTNSLVYQGSFRGKQTAQTDGIDLSQRPTKAFPNGVLYAIDKDRSLTAFDIRDIVKQLKLPTGCLN